MKAGAEPVRMVLACCPVGPLVLALDAACVENVWDRASEPWRKPWGRTVDLAAFYGVEVSEAATQRRYLEIDCDGPLSILAGVEVAVHELVGVPRPLPTFVAGLAERAGLLGVVEWARGYAFVLDPHRLRALEVSAHDRGLL